MEGNSEIFTEFLLTGTLRGTRLRGHGPTSVRLVGLTPPLQTTIESQQRRNSMRSRHFAILGILFAVFALAVMANVLTTATATADCSGYTLTVGAADLSVGTMYTIDYSFTLTCGGSITTVKGSIPFTAAATTTTQMVTASWPTTPLPSTCTVTGSATLTSSGSTVPIIING